MRRYQIILPVLFSAFPLAIVGCGGSLARPDGGPNAGGAGGTTGGGGTVGGGGTIGIGGSSAGGSGMPPDLRAQLDAAKVTWTAAKGNCTIYSYERPVDTGWGVGPWTDVEIRNDLPTRRRFWLGGGVVDGGVGWVLVWDESGSQVGQHTGDSSVFPASAVEQLQAECETVLARDPVANTLTLTIDARGVPTMCSYWPVGCFDGCRMGMTIRSFGCAPLSDDAGPTY